MKKLCLVAVLFILPFLLLSQVKKIKTYENSANVVKIGSDYFYYDMDVNNSKCNIFDSNHNPYKTITFTLPEDYYLYDVKFISTNLFNTDNLIEVLYTCYQYNTTGQYYNYFTKIINENGVELMDAPGALYSYLKMINDTEYCLFLYCYDNSVNPYTVWTNIYSLSGTVLIDDIIAKNSDPFPNPAKELVAIPINGNNESDALLSIFDLRGQKIKEFMVSNPTRDFMLNTRLFIPGTYLYTVSIDGKETANKKLIIQ